MKGYAHAPVRTRRRVRAIAWLALITTLFSAISPAVAGVLLRDQPRALARMLGIADAPQPAARDAHHAHHRESAPEPAQSPHTDHGIYCSFCLNASSTLAMPGEPPAAVLAQLVAATGVLSGASVFITAFHPLFRSRAPPALSLPL